MFPCRLHQRRGGHSKTCRGRNLSSCEVIYFQKLEPSKRLKQAPVNSTLVEHYCHIFLGGRSEYSVKQHVIISMSETK